MAEKCRFTNKDDFDFHVLAFEYFQNQTKEISSPQIWKAHWKYFVIDVYLTNIPFFKDFEPASDDAKVIS